MTWEGKTSSPVTSAAPASRGAAVKLPEKLKVSHWTSRRLNLRTADSFCGCCRFGLARWFHWIELLYLSLLPVTWQKALLLERLAIGLG